MQSGDVAHQSKRQRIVEAQPASVVTFPSFAPERPCVSPTILATFGPMSWKPGWVLLSALLLATGCTIETEARAPQANILGKIKGGGTFQIDVSSAPEEMVCSEQGG